MATTKTLLQQMKGMATQTGNQWPPKANNRTKAGDNAEALAKALDQHLLLRNEPKFKQSYGFTASATNDCQRRFVYLMRGVQIEQDFDPRTLRIFDNGNGVHERLGKYFTDMGIVISIEEEFFTVDPPIHGFIDIIFEWAGGPKIGEFKSINDSGYVKLKMSNRPKDDHIHQAQIYMAVKEIPEAYIIYENKNTQELLMFGVTHDPEYTDKLFAKWRKTHKLHTDGKLPKRPARSPSSTKCKYCEVKSICWSDPDNGV